MTRVLLVDDSPHAQRMGERILADEGYEVVTVSNADAAMIRLADADPDVVVADTVMPGRTGFDICHYLKMNPRHKHVRVILTAGVLESLDEEEARRVDADGTLKKPFEATALLGTVRPLAEAAVAERPAATERPRAVEPPPTPAAQGPEPVLGTSAATAVPLVDSEQVRAAVTVALDASMGMIVEEITRQVLSTLALTKPEEVVVPSAAGPEPPPAPMEPAAREPAAGPSPEPPTGAVRRVSRVRVPPSSVLGVNLGPAEQAPDRE
jgi:CheY-like chemotaxis protein